MAKKRSNKGKGSFATYKAENRVYKNKIRKLERHIKKFPDDEAAKENLKHIQKSGYKGRVRPVNPGSNKTSPKNPLKGYILPKEPETAGEQLARLLGISLPAYTTQRIKTKILTKKRKNVNRKSEKVS